MGNAYTPGNKQPMSEAGSQGPVSLSRSEGPPGPQAQPPAV